MASWDIHTTGIVEWLEEYEGPRFHAILADPPYALISIAKRFGPGQAPAQEGEDGRYERLSRGFMGASWDSFRDYDQYQSWVAQWSKQLIEKALYPGALCLFFGGCYDAKTDILTLDGWKSFSDVGKTDQIATLNPENNEIEYHRPLEIVQQPYKGRMYRIQNKKVDLLVTEDHWMYAAPYDTRNKAKHYERRQAKDIAFKHCWFKKNALWVGKQPEHFLLPACERRYGGTQRRVGVEPEKRIPIKQWLKFFGLWMAEGSASRSINPTGQSYKISMTHFNISNFDELRAELLPWFNVRIYPPSRANINNRQLYEYLVQFGHARDKYIPAWLKNLSPSLIRIFLEWFRRGDGDQTSARFRLYTSSKRLADDLQELALKAGWSADIYQWPKPDGEIDGRVIKARGPLYTVAVNLVQNEPHKDPNKVKREEWIDFEGEVYCVEVPNHIIYVRRGGKAVWCGNTRTFHHLGVGLERGGFEIVDSILIPWLHGQGFPKSHDISKGLDKQGGKFLEDRSGFAQHIKTCREEAKVSKKELASWFPYAEVTKNWERTDLGNRVPSLDDYNVLVERIGCDPEYRDLVRQEAEREVIGRAEGGIGLANLGEAGYKDEWDVTAPATPEAETWDGYGTALKPAWEPVFVCRAPRGDMTFAELAVEFGTGALNIDGARIGYTSEGDKHKADPGGKLTSKSGALAGGTQHGGERTKFERQEQRGRWPANLMLTHHEACVKVGEYMVEGRTINRFTQSMMPFGGAEGEEYETEQMPPETVERWACVPGCPARMLDDQVGELTAGTAVRRHSGISDEGMFKFGNRGPEPDMAYGGSGGPSRFFYTSKASRSEKDKGLENFYWKRTGDGNWVRISEEEWAETDRTLRGRGCIHPTVKPLALLRYLATLILPPSREEGRRLLVPFSGSGSEMIAAMQAGWDQVEGVEMADVYVEMAEARIRATIGML